MVALPNGGASDTLLMQLAYAACIARWRHAEQRITSRCQPVIEDWAKLSKWPHREDGRQPLPTWQHANHFDPREITFVPTTVGRAHVHFVSHRCARMRRCAFQNFRIVVIEPLNAMIAIERLYPRTHPA